MSLDNITVTRTSEDGLTQTQWSFFRLSADLLVNSYEELERPSARHKFKVVREWNRMGSMRMNKFRKEDVPLPDDIKKEALESFVAQMAAGLTVKFQA